MNDALRRTGGDPSRGFLYALAGTSLQATSYVTAKIALGGFNPETFGLIWVLSATIFCLVIVLLIGRGKDLRLPATAVRKVIPMGVATGAGMILSWAGLDRLDPSFAAFLARLYPALTMLLGVIFLREKLTARDFVTTGFMIAGGGLIVLGRWQAVGLGTILMVLSCVAIAAQVLIAKTQVSTVNTFVLAFYRVGTGSVVVALWTLVTRRADFNVAAPYWLVAIGGAFLAPCAAYILLFQSFRHWNLSQTSMVQTIQPLLVLPLAYLTLGKLPTSRELLGGCLILTGAFIWTMGRIPRGARHPPWPWPAADAANLRTQDVPHGSDSGR